MNNAFVTLGLDRVPPVPMRRVREAVDLMRAHGWRERMLRRRTMSMRTDTLSSRLIRLMPDLAYKRTGSATERAEFDQAVSEFEVIFGDGRGDGACDLVLAWQSQRGPADPISVMIHTALVCEVPILDIDESDTFAVSAEGFLAWISDPRNLSAQVDDNLERYGRTRVEIEIARRNLGLFAAMRSTNYADAANTFVDEGVLAADDRLAAAADAVAASAVQLGHNAPVAIIEHMGKVIDFPAQFRRDLDQEQARRIDHARLLSEQAVRNGAVSPSEVAQIIVSAEETGARLLDAGSGGGGDLGLDLINLASTLSQSMAQHGLVPIERPGRGPAQTEQQTEAQAPSSPPPAAPGRDAEPSTVAWIGDYRPPTPNASALPPVDVALEAVQAGEPYPTTVTRLVTARRLAGDDPRVAFAGRDLALDGFLLPEALVLRIADLTRLHIPDATAVIERDRGLIASLAKRLADGDFADTQGLLRALAAAERLALHCLRHGAAETGRAILAVSVSLSYSMVVRQLGRHERPVVAAASQAPAAMA